MTDKHGVDVSGCKDRYLGYRGSSCQNTGPSCPDIKCENNKDCYYRQLKRKEQKLERIRELLINITEAGLCEAKECGCDDNKECLECTLNEIKDVIQIIDKVENGRKIL